MRSEIAAALVGSFLSGAMMNLSILDVPVLLDTSTSASGMVTQWCRIYYYGHKLYPTLCISTCLLYGHSGLGYQASGDPWRVYAIAGATTLAMVPFTWIFMQPTNNTLFRAQKLSKDGQELAIHEARRLLIKWGWLHLARSLFPLTGAVLGLLGAFRLVEW